MVQILLQSFTRAEMTIGIVVTILLITGRNDPRSIGLSLGGLAAFILVHGLLPLSRRDTRVLRSASSTPREGAESQKTKTPCTSQMSRRMVILRGILMAAFVGLTAVLIYRLAP
jgi:hypothetical protein